MVNALAAAIFDHGEEAVEPAQRLRIAGALGVLPEALPASNPPALGRLTAQGASLILDRDLDTAAGEVLSEEQLDRRREALREGTEFAQLPGGRHGLGDDYIDESQRRRLRWGLIGLVADVGYPAVTTDGIAASASVSRNALYAHYEGREDCFDAARAMAVEQLVNRLEASPRQGAQARCEAAIAFLDANPLLACFLSPRSSFATPQLAAHYAKWTGSFTEKLAADSDRSSVGFAARAVVGGMLWSISDWIDRGCELEADALAEQLAHPVSAAARGPAPAEAPARSGPPAEQEVRVTASSERYSASRDLVGQAQHERLLAAVIGQIAQRGYEQTTIDHIITAARVASSTFLNHFESKQDLAACAYESATADLRASTAEASERGTSAAIQALLEALVERPDLARFALLEIPLAIRGGFGFYRQTLDGAATALGRHPAAPAGVTGSMLAAGLLRGVSGRSPAGLDTAATELAGLALASPSDPVDAGVGQGFALPFGDGEPAERLLAAMVELTGRYGYRGAKVEDLERMAQTSRSTLYRHFGGKDECFLVAYRRASAFVWEGFAEGLQSAQQWADGVRAAVGSFVGVLAANPDLLRFLSPDTLALSPAVAEQQKRALRSFAPLLVPGADSEELMPAQDAVIGAVFWRLADWVDRGAEDDLGPLASELTDFVLARSFLWSA